MRTIIFDFGNVVAFFDHGKTLDKVKAFTDLSHEMMRQVVYAGELEDLFEKGVIGEMEFLHRVVGLWRLRCEADVLAEAFVNVFEPNPEVCDLIPRLAGRYRLLLGSNTNLLHARKFRAQFADVLSHFHHLVLSCEIGARKPSAPFFEHCLKHAGPKAEDCLFIDDLPANVEGARAIGMNGLVYDRAARLVSQLEQAGISI